VPLQQSLPAPCYFPDRAANGGFVPCSAETASLFGGKISLFAKLGKLGSKSLIWREARREVRQSNRAICRFRCILDRREFAAADDSALNRLIDPPRPSFGDLAGLAPTLFSQPIGLLLQFLRRPQSRLPDDWITDPLGKIPIPMSELP